MQIGHAEVWMVRPCVLLLGLVYSISPAFADSRQDCIQIKYLDLKITGCEAIINADPRAAWANTIVVLPILRLLSTNPKYGLAYNNRGLAYQSKGDYDRAIADYNQAIKLSPKSVIAYNNRGNAYQGKGEYDRAIADCNQAIKINPKDALPYNNRGWAYRNKGDYDRAIEDATTALTLVAG
jgi:tetratricopeptide (TPR) repeat protein